MADVIAESVVAIPAPPVREHVARYIGFRYDGFPAAVHAGLPSRVRDGGHQPGPSARPRPDARRGPPATFEALAGGLHDTAVAIRHDGSQHGIQLAVTASGCRALFGMPAAELARTVITLHEVMPPAGEVCDRLRAAAGWPQRFAILDAVLTRLAASPCLEPAAALAWKRLCESDGRMRVDELARDAGYSRRHLTARFRAEYGLAPKTAARVMRFERARALLVRPEPPSLARIAAACGHADQAHMNREWRALAGASPLGWRAAEVLPFVQDADSAREAGSGA